MAERWAGAELLQRLRADRGGRPGRPGGATTATTDGTVPIGAPVANTRLHVLDRYLRPVPAGMPGELYLAGAQLARGYHGRPGADRGRGSSPTRSARPATRMYRTGDLVRRLADGALVYLGRTDHQVKIRGNRVELGEIEARLAARPRRRARRPADGHGARWSATSRRPRGHRRPCWPTLAASLPAPLVPDAFVVLDALPRTPSGKLDRAALPAPGRRARTGHGDPRDDAGARAVRDLRRGPRLDRVGADDDFFTLGGDSILSITVSSQARRRAWRSARGTCSSTAPRPPSPPLGPATHPARCGDRRRRRRRSLLPIVHQLRERGGPIDRFYALHARAQPRPSATSQRLAAALQAVLDRHDGLRLADPVAPVLWSLETRPDAHRSTCTASTCADWPATAAAVDRRRGRRRRGPARPRRRHDAAARLVRRGSRPGRLLLAAHHLAVDGVSWRILFEDLATAWRGRPSSTRCRTSLRRFARTVAEQAQARHRLAELPHWTETLAPGADLLPGARPRDGRATCAPTCVELATEDTEPLLRGTELQDVLLAALADRGHPPARGRRPARRPGTARPGAPPELDLSRTVGWFTSVHPVRLPSTSDPVAQLRLVRERAAGRAGQRSRLRHAALPQRPGRAAARRAAAAQVLFNYFGRFPAARQRGLDARTGGRRARPCCPTADLGAVPPAGRSTRCARETPDGPTGCAATWTWPPARSPTADVARARRRVARRAATSWPELGPTDAVGAAAGVDSTRPRSTTCATSPGSRWPTSGRCPRCRRACSSTPATTPPSWTSTPAQDAFDFDHRLDLDRLRAACADAARPQPQRCGPGSPATACRRPVQFVAAAPELPVDGGRPDRAEPPSSRTRADELMAADRRRRFDLAARRCAGCC